MRRERKTSKSKLFKKLLSGTLAFAMIATSVPLLNSITSSDTVYASGGSDNSGGGSLSSGGAYDNYEVIAIYPSKLREASSASELKNISNRYYSRDFQNYPILFRVSYTGNPDYSRNQVMIYDGKKTPSFTTGSKYINQANLSDSDVKFFYDSISNRIANKKFSDPTAVIDDDENMGTSLNNEFGLKNAKKWTANNNANKKKFFRGFSKALKKLYPNAKSGGQSISEIVANCNSFTVERYWGLSGSKQLYSAGAFASLCAAGDSTYGSSLMYREYDAIFGNYDGSGSGYRGKTAGNWANFLNSYGKMWRVDLKSIFPSIYNKSTKKVEPALVSDKLPAGCNTRHSFAGWCFFELSHGNNDVVFEDKAYVKSQVTYNAYLGDISESESSKFGKNGLVTTDLVSTSAKANYDLVDRYVKFSVDNSIQLDTPYTGARFNLNKLDYRVTNPQGSKVLFYEKDNYSQSNTLGIGRAYALRSAYQKAKDINQNNWATTYTMEDEKYEVFDDTVISALNKKYPNANYGTFKGGLSSTSYATIKSSGKYIAYGTDRGTNREKLYVKKNGTWYYCPVTAETNLLIQVRADYLKKYSKDEVGKIQTMQSYLLSKQYDLQEDFVNDSLESLRTMIDAYPTTLWGAVKNRTVQSSIQDDSGNVTAIDLQNVVNGYFKYNLRRKGTAENEVTPLYSTAHKNDGNRTYDALYAEVSLRNGSKTKNVTIAGALNAFNNTFIDSNVHFGTSSGQVSSSVKTLFNGKNVKNNTASQDSAPTTSTTKNLTSLSLLYHGKYVNGKYVAGSKLSANSWLTGDKQLKSESVQNLAIHATGYKATDFSKLVAKYSKTYSFIRGKNASATAPNVASWKANGLQATYKSTLGLNTADVGKNVKTASAKSSTSSKLYDYGFARLGLGGKIIYNNSNNPATLTDVTVMTGSNTPVTSISALKNSSVDIPLRVKWEQYFTGERKSTTTSTIGSTLKVNPEVTMWYQSTTGSYGSVVTAGDYIRNIPIVPYNILSVKNNSSDPKVTGTSVALDARAKTLASKLADEDTPVLYSGSGVTLTYDKVPNVELTSYMLDIADSRSNLKSTWGNKYSAETSVRTMVSNADAKADIKSDLTVNDQKLTLKELNNCSLKAGDSKLEETWYLTVKGGEITNVNVNGQNYGSGSFSAGSGKSHEIGVALREMKLIGNNNILSQVFAKGAGEKITDSGLKTWLTNNGGKKYLNKGWYYEDTSVLVVKKFKTDFSLSDTTISDKLPMNLGPQTPADRNQFFSNGYTATADLTTVFNINIVGAKLTGKSSTDRVKEKKVDFIVPDVSIKDSYGV